MIVVRLFSRPPHWLRNCAFLGLVVGLGLVGTEAIAQRTDETAPRRVPAWMVPKGAYQAAKPIRNDLLHTRLDLRPDWARQTLEGTATLTLRPHFYPQDVLELDAKRLAVRHIVRMDTLPYSEAVVNRIAAREDAARQRDLAANRIFEPEKVAPAPDPLDFQIPQDTARARLDSLLKDRLLREAQRASDRTDSLAALAPPTHRDTILTAEGVLLALDTLRFQNDGALLTIDLNKLFNRGEHYTLRIAYATDSSARRGIYFVNPLEADSTKPRQLWTQGETESNSYWFPTLDAPNVKMTQDVFLTVENRFKTLSNGTLVESWLNPDVTRTDHWQQIQPHAPYLTMIAAGDYAVVDDEGAGGVPVSYYVEPAFAPYAKAIFGRTPEMLRFFGARFGVSFPWDKYAQLVARDFVGGAKENTSATVHGEAIQKTPRQLLDGNDDEAIAHELAHQWFGNYVTAESWAHVVLNESFAAYAEYLWDEYKYGPDEANQLGLKQLNDYLAESEKGPEALVQFDYQNTDQLFNSHAYQKGARVLHLLRHTAGDEAFFTTINRYLRRHAYGTAELSDLRTVLEEVTGEDWNAFFDQWFYAPGHPQIKVEKDYADGRLNLTVSQTQDSSKAPIFKVPTTVELWSDGKFTRYYVTLDQARQTFHFPVPKAPDLVLLDPERIIPGSIEQAKTPAELVYQYQHTPYFTTRYEAVTGLEDRVRDTLVRGMMQQALRDKFWRIREVAATNFAEYEASEYLAVETALQDLARHDPAPQVRLEALVTLVTFNDDDNLPLFKEALQDSSSQVSAQALRAYLQTRPDDASQVVSRFERSDNPDVVVALGSYLATQAEEGRFEWFQQQLENLGSSGLYEFLPVFGRYLLRSTPRVKERSVTALETLARSNPTNFVRMAAYQVLGLLTDLNGVREIRRDIRTREKDPKLLEMYGQMKDL